MPTEAAIARIGPEMDGMPMSLAEFAQAEVDEGYLYELERGVVVVDGPRLPHSVVVRRLRRAIEFHDAAHPGRVVHVAGGNDSVMRLPGMESERHPDVAVYLTHPPDPDNPWDSWTPDIVFEVVSNRSIQRDYELKREEYLRAGVRNYYIIDPLKRGALLLERIGDSWKEAWFGADAPLTIPILPGFNLPLASMFAPVE
jgi:Uma2 family endonuclease